MDEQPDFYESESPRIAPDPDHAEDCGEVAVDVAERVNAKTLQVENMIHLLIEHPDRYEQSATLITPGQALELIALLEAVLAYIEDRTE